MFSYIQGIRNILPLFFMGLFILITGVSPVVSAAQEDPAISPLYQITDIALSSGELHISPGMNISPIITIVNLGGERDPGTTLQCHATLGPVQLTGNNTIIRLPDMREQMKIPLTFTVPFIQPGDYPLKITITLSEESDIHIAPQSMRAKKFIQVIRPQPGSGARTCGCS